jgi:hypothetical protein
MYRRSAPLKVGLEVSLVSERSMAADYAEELREWLPDATEVRLVARHEGRDAASVNAFVDAARGRAKTLTFVETENGGSICGGYLDVAWAEGYVRDPGERSFIFTLKNHLGVPPTEFAQKRSDIPVSYMRLGERVCFGSGEGFDVVPGGNVLNNGRVYEAPATGTAVFNGDDSGRFLAARWELWEVVRSQFDWGCCTTC